jgi:DNA topoisomerase VI subunit B
MGPDFSPKMAVKGLTSQQLVRIHQLFRQAKFDDPSGNVWVPFHLDLFQILSAISP